ncbi:uncharacterized protein LOC123304982 isoform X2 [Chrysoperla carnea]|uniref:uncharacterized protein LOC123304982 isoform X2 n=1 Tax=Chrysoperla carnea TaxID=189513 RepID=UPI001D0611CA|nr:uncharacterized protein LOC123304982 isoform X2 [Chrysoperla carnea]
MISKHLFILLILIPNIIATKTIKENLQLSFSSLTEIEDGVANIADENYVRPQSTVQRQHQETQDKPPEQEACNKERKTYCLNPPDYPEEEIRKLLEESKINISAFNMDINFDDTSSTDLTNRGDIRNAEQLCKSINKLIEPKQAETEEGEWLFIIPGQKMEVEECLEDTVNKSCSLLNGVQTICEQKYLLRKLYYLQEGTKKEIGEAKKFKIPSCCMCMVVPAAQRLHDLRRRHVSNQRNKRNARGTNPHFAYPHQIKTIKHQQPTFSTRFTFENINCTEQVGNLCTKVENYPVDIIKKLRRKGAFKNSPLFGKDELPTVLSTRGDSENRVPMCGAQPRTIYPPAAKNIANEEKFLVQDMEGGYVQGVVVEECVNKDHPPCEFAHTLPPEYVTKCVQQYVHRKLVTIDTSSQTTESDIFPIPSCCMCHVSRETSMSTNG